MTRSLTRRRARIGVAHPARERRPAAHPATPAPEPAQAPAPASPARRARAGILLVLLSAAAYGSVATASQLAYGADVSPLALVSNRFLLAATALWLLVAALRRRLPSRRDGLAALALGLPYGAHVALLAGSYSRLDVGLADLLFFVNPVLVMAGAVALRRERWTRRRGLALTVALGGLAFTLAAGGAGGLDPLGATFSLGAAVAYAAFVLGSTAPLKRTDPLVLTAFSVTGAALAFAVAAAASGDAGVPGGGLGLIAITALLGTVVAPVALLAGVRCLGASRSSIVGSAEPVLSAMLGVAVLGDRIGPLQVLGAGLVLAAIPILEARARGRRAPLARRLRSAQPRPRSA